MLSVTAPSGRLSAHRLPAAAGPELGEVLDPLAGAPLGVVVLHGVDELAHEPRREVDPRHHDARDLLVLDLMVYAGEGDRELVIGVADVREVRVDAGHDLRGEVDVDVALGAGLIGCHGPSVTGDEAGRRVRGPAATTLLRRRPALQETAGAPRQARAHRGARGRGRGAADSRAFARDAARDGRAGVRLAVLRALAGGPADGRARPVLRDRRADRP